MESIGGDLNKWIEDEGHYGLQKLSRDTGITFEYNLKGLRGKKEGNKTPTFEVHSLRPAQCVGPDGNALNQLIISLRARASLSPCGAAVTIAGGHNHAEKRSANSNLQTGAW